MQITRQTLFFSATRQIDCSREQALVYFSRLTAINLDRLTYGKCPHSAEYCFWENEGILIAGTDFDAANLPGDICVAIAELLNVVNIDHVDITFSVCSPIFSASSHRGGIVRVFRNGRTLLGSANL